MVPINNLRDRTLVVCKCTECGSYDIKKRNSYTDF